MNTEQIHSKRCSMCSVCQPLSEYFKNRGRLMARCKTCHQAGIGSMAKWTDANNDVIRAFYPTGGAAAVKVVLPNRSVSAINKQAGRIGVDFLTAAGAPRLRPEEIAGTEPSGTPIPYLRPELIEAHKSWQSVRVPAYVTGNLSATLGMAA